MPNISKTILDRSLPQYIQSEYPMFELFMKAYYEYLEQQNYPIDVIKNLKQYRNIDTTLDSFTEHFETEYLNKFPSAILADKRLLIIPIDFCLEFCTMKIYHFISLGMIF